MRLVLLTADIFDTICGPSIIHPAAHYRKIVQNIVQCLASNSYNPEGESYATGSSDVEGIFTSLLDGGFDWTVCECLEFIYVKRLLIRPSVQQSEMLPHSRTSPPAADSTLSPYQMGRTITHKHRYYISLPSLHSGRTPGRSFRSLFLFVPFSCIAFPPCFPSLSFISLVPLLQLWSPRHPQVRSHLA